MKQVNQKSEFKLVVVTRSDISPGYQLVQANHATADFAYEHPEMFKEWKESTNTIITLQIENEDSLVKLYDELYERGSVLTLFREPDIQNQATSLCALGTPEVKRKVSKLKLSLQNN